MAIQSARLQQLIRTRGRLELGHVGINVQELSPLQVKRDAFPIGKLKQMMPRGYRELRRSIVLRRQNGASSRRALSTKYTCENSDLGSAAMAHRRLKSS